MPPFLIPWLLKIMASFYETSFNSHLLRKKPRKPRILFAGSIDLPNFAVLNF